MIVHTMFHVKHAATGGLARVRADLARTGMMLAAGVLATAFAPAVIARDAAPAQAAASPAMPDTPAPPVPDKTVFEETGKLGEASRSFSYSWPKQVAAIPALVTRFTAERDKLLAEQRADWDEALREFAGSDCTGCVNRDYAMQWDVVANLPRFLSLSGAWSAYTGGAHGNYAWQALVWDREAKKAFDPKSMFTSPDALQGALGPAWCKALKVERVKKGMAPEDEDGIFPCPPIADLTVLVGSSDRKSFNRIGLIADPYVAGSYAEGEYEVTLPVTAKVLAAVKPAYRTAFALGK